MLGETLSSFSIARTRKEALSNSTSPTSVSDSGWEWRGEGKAFVEEKFPVDTDIALTEHLSEQPQELSTIPGATGHRLIHLVVS